MLKEAFERTALDSDQSPVALIELDRRRRIAAINSGAETLFGLSRLSGRGRKLSDLLYHDCLLFDLIDRAEETAASVSAADILLEGPGLKSKGVQYSSASRTQDGGFALALFRGNAGSANGSDKTGLAAFGRILGHEVKNPLAGVSGATQLLLRGAREDQTELLELILSESKRITRLVDKLSAFELFSAPRRLPCNIHQILEQVIRAEELAFGDVIRFDRNFDPSLPDVFADGDHLHEAFQNIIRNAGEAVREAGVGETVTVSTRFSLDTRRTRAGVSAPVRSILVRIEDNGPGIARADQKSIFEMFQTSKANGSGLGLTVAGQVIAAHDGQLELESRPRHTEFRVYLPLVKDT